MIKQDMQNFLLGMACGAGVLFLILRAVWDVMPAYHWHRQIIEHGAGQYNKTTGAFEWITVDSGRAP